MSDTAATVQQLNAARDIVLRDAAIYPQVVAGVLPVISSSHPVELRRWGSEFLAETFASPVLDAAEKEKLALQVLDTVRGYLARKEEVGEEEDEGVVKAAVQAATSIYPLLFRHIIGDAEDGEVWTKMLGIKSNILKRMDSAPGGVRICCIKFVARVVQVQTPGVIADPRRGDQNEISLALVQRDHKVLAPQNLEAEASGLLDRLLGVLQDNIADPLIITATLNALAPLVQRRATIAPKILTTVLNFNPLTLAEKSAGTRGGAEKVAVRSMTRTTMSFLLNILKRQPSHPLHQRIQQSIERLRIRLTEVFAPQDANNTLKRSAPDEPTDGLSDEKRRRLDVGLDAATQDSGTPQQPQQYAALPSGPVSVGQLFTLTTDQRAAAFHVEVTPAQIASALVPHLLAQVDPQRFETAINVVRARVLELQRRPPPGAPGAGGIGTDEGDDSYTPPDVDGTPPPTTAAVGGMEGMGLAIQPFHLPPPEPLSPQEMGEFEETAKDRLFTALQRLEEESRRKVKTSTSEKEIGFNRLASTTATGEQGQDRDGWICLLTRLATRSSPQASSADDGEGGVAVKDEYAVQKPSQAMDLPTRIREAFHKYILDDWRPRIDVAIAWLNEEWYSEKLLTPTSSLPIYTTHLLRLLDALIPYLDTKDGRYLTRLLSEIPSIPAGVWERIERIALDPERVKLATDLLLYLIMLRPPVREQALDCAERMWRGNAAAKGVVGKVVGKWRPGVLKAEGQGEGVKKEEA